MARQSGVRYEGDLRRDFMDAALERIATTGPETAGLRAIARELGVSHGAPAKHFRDRHGLFTEIAIEAFDLLDQALRASVADAQGEQPLASSAVAYIDFAIDHPGHFILMWRPDLYHGDDPRLRALANRTYDHLTQQVKNAQASGWMPDRDHGDVVAHVWSAVHGFAQLWHTRAFRSLYPGDRSPAIRRTVEILLRDLA